MSTVDYPTVSEWQDLVGRRFDVADHSLELTLTEVEVISEHTFALLLAGPRETLLPQATYPLDGIGTEPVPVFLVPIGVDAEAARYEAIFNSMPPD